MGGKKENKRKFRNLGEAFSNSAFESPMKNVYSIQYIHILYTLHSIQYTEYSTHPCFTPCHYPTEDVYFYTKKC